MLCSSVKSFEIDKELGLVGINFLVGKLPEMFLFVETLCSSLRYQYFYGWVKSFVFYTRGQIFSDWLEKFTDQ